MSELNQQIESTPVKHFTFSGSELDGYTAHHWDSYSVGIFRVLAKSGGRGKKKDRAILRISTKQIPAGKTLQDAAQYVCDWLNQHPDQQMHDFALKAFQEWKKAQS